MARAVQLSDPTFTPKARRNAAERLVLRLINDERDLPFVWLSLRMTLVILPAAALLYWPGMFRWWMAPIYWVGLFGLFVGPYVLMLHNTSHRRLFKRRYRFLNHYIPWVLGPFCGETPETYYTHHVTMHHKEENLREDLSSTMRFQRDRPLDFARYFLRFFFCILPDLGRYQARKGRWVILRRMLIGELGFYVVVAGLMFVNWQATLVVFVAPLLMVRFAMMAGNWGQHAFIDAADPANPYKNSITCINSLYNRRCFNDGYHIGHHVSATRHWTEMPEDFANNRETYVKEDSVVFEGIDFFGVWALLMMRRYDALARKFVDLRDEPRSHEEIVELLRSRTRRIAVERPSSFSGPLLARPAARA